MAMSWPSKVVSVGRGPVSGNNTVEEEKHGRASRCKVMKKWKDQARAYRRDVTPGASARKIVPSTKEGGSGAMC